MVTPPAANIIFSFSKRKFLMFGLTPDQEDLYRRIVDGPRAQTSGISPILDSSGNLVGPFKSFLISPKLGSILEQLGRHLRYEHTISAIDKELSILRVSRHVESKFEWLAHVDVARGLGVSEQELDSIWSLDSEPLSIYVRCVDEIIKPGDKKSSLSSLGLLDEEKRMHLIALVGYYVLIANLMHEFGE